MLVGRGSGGVRYLFLSYWENQNVLQQDLDLFHASGYRC